LEEVSVDRSKIYLAVWKAPIAVRTHRQEDVEVGPKALEEEMEESAEEC
jgi:hypothetical protein